MLIRPQIYYFGRLNLATAYSDKRQLINSALNSDQSLDSKGYRWRFFDIATIEHTSGEYFTGYLAKYKLTTEEETADEEHRTIFLEEASKRIAAKSRFFLHTNSGLISYHQVRHKIMRDQFNSNFCHLFEIAHDHFFVHAEIQSIDEQYEILEIMRKFDAISKVSIYLHPSNPHSGIWKETDQRLKQRGISSYKEEYSAKQGGSLNVVDDEDFNSKVNMAVDGYGEASILGTHEGQEKMVHTGQNPVTAKSPHKDTEYPEVFKDLQKAWENIFNRFRQL